MASNVTASRLSPVILQRNEESQTEDTQKDATNAPEVLPGAEIPTKEIFCNKQGRMACLTPVLVDFRRLLESKSSVPVITGIPNRELLHSVIGLYDVSLSDMTPDVLYSTVCDKQARTILLVRGIKDVMEELNNKVEPLKEEDSSEVKELVSYLEKDLERCENDVYVPSVDPPAAFHQVYSDTEPDNEEESDEEEEDFSKGINTYIKKARSRRRARLLPSVRDRAVGAENRIVAALTFDKTFIKTGEKVVHLTLFAVRKRFRRMGIGKYLINKVKDQTLVGSYDAVVVHADNAALDFFSRYGFTDDIVLNSRWSEIAEQFTNCTLMCYLPPFTGQTLMTETIPELDLIAMEKELKKWRDRSIDAYRAEMSCVNRLRTEIIHLRALVDSQQHLISKLAAENQTMRREKYLIQKEFLEYRLSTAKTQLNDDDDDDTVEELIRKLEMEAKLSTSTGKRNYYVSGNSDEPYDHGKDTEEFYKVSKNFYEAMREDPNITMAYEVKMVSKAILASDTEEAISHSIQQLREDKRTPRRLYFCGTLLRPNRIPLILSRGFTHEDLSNGEYGKGLYFSQYPSKAAQFSALGKLLIAEVYMGNVEHVTDKEPTRKEPSRCFNSIITPGRVTPNAEGEAPACQEYVLFNPDLARPLYLIEYSPYSK